MSFLRESEDPLLNYFICTLGEAAKLPPSKFTTANDLIDKQAKNRGEKFACGFPARQGEDREWSYDLFSSRWFTGSYAPSVANSTSIQRAPGKFNRAAEELVPVVENKDTDESAKFVALLCASSIDFLFSWLGLMRAGFAVLLTAGVVASICWNFK